MSNLTPKRLCFTAVLICVVLRVALILLDENAFESDPDAYKAIAQTLHQHGVFGLTPDDGIPRPIAFRPPLYPWMLSWIVVDGQVSGPWLGTLHVFLAALTTLLVFTIGRNVVSSVGGVSGTRASFYSFVASVLVTIDPVLARQSTEAMTETLATTLSTAVIALWWQWNSTLPGLTDRRRFLISLALGMLLALAYLCRPTFLVWAALLAIAMVVARQSRSAIISASVVVLIVGLSVAGWTLRNRSAIGHSVWATTHGGYTLLLGNNESFYRHLGEASFGQAWDASDFIDSYNHRYEGDPKTEAFWSIEWKTPPSFDPTATEYDDDRLAYQSAIATIKRHPVQFIWSAIVRVGRLWAPIPHGVAGRSVIAIAIVSTFYVLLWAAAIFAVIRHRNAVFTHRFWAVWLLAFALTGVHSLYWSNMRMRAPLMPSVAVFAVLSCVSSLRKR